MEIDRQISNSVGARKSTDVIGENNLNANESVYRLAA